MAYSYVTNDGTRWGVGTGVVHEPDVLDRMWWETAEAIAELQAFMADPGIPTVAGFEVDGATFSVLMSSGGPLGPYLLPVPKLRYRSDLNGGAWAADSNYASNDTFTQGGSSYFVGLSHHSDETTFDPEATDGLGHRLYGVLVPYAPLGLDDLSDVTLTAEATGDILWLVDGEWVNVALDAAMVPFAGSTASGLDSDNVADALEELAALVAAFTIDAADVTFTAPTASALVSTNVADALVELEGMIPDLAGYATESYVDTAVSDLRDGVSASFDTLSEIATALALKLTSSDIGVTVQAYDPQLSSLVRQNSKSAAYTTVLTDGGKDIFHPSTDNNARIFTIDSNANVAYPIGTVISFTNMINTVTIAITADTLTLLGSGSTGSRTLAANGSAVARKIGTTQWVISGPGLT